MADIKINGATPRGFYYGGTAASAVYYGSTKLWEAAAPDPYNTLFYSLGSETIQSDSAKVIDLRAAGLPTTSERPYIAFYSEITYSGTKSAAGNEITYGSASDTPIFGLAYQKNPNSSATTSYPYFIINGQVGASATTSSTRRLKTIFFFDTTYTNKWCYRMYYSANGSSWSPTNGSSFFPIDNTPFDMTYLFTPGTSTAGWVRFSNMKCAGFTDETVAQNWNGSWPISQ